MHTYNRQVGYHLRIKVLAGY